MTAIDRRLFTVTLFLDFPKAFDTVNKTIMLRKLDRYGFRNYVNYFLNSYLSDRKMYVTVNGSDSTVISTNIGLPQGSVTSPWLFSLYINGHEQDIRLTQLFSSCRRHDGLYDLKRFESFM